MSNKNILITNGYPRSGNTFLNQALNLLYYPNEIPRSQHHSVISIEKNNQVIVPFRNPLDCIASWQDFSSQGTLKHDINFYIRITKAILDNKKKVILMDFDYFIQDIEYIKNKIKINFGLTTNEIVTVNDVKNAMLKSDKEKHLPRDNKDLLDSLKGELIQIPKFQECIDLHLQLKKLAE